MEWISVKEKIPKDVTYCIVCLENKVVTEMIFSPYHTPKWFKPAIGSEAEDNTVTHWMPLPEPAKE